MSTKERLAQKLNELGLFDLEKRARIGEFSDFESPHACPKIVFVEALNKLSIWDKPQIQSFINQVMNGDWNDTKEEAKAWYQKEGKDLI